MLFFRILIFIAATVLGILILKYQKKIVDLVGHNQWADEHLGMGSEGGGTYLMWTIIAFLVIIAGVYILIKGW